MKIEIREADISDVKTIADFNSRMALETEEKALDPARIEAGVSGLIEDPGKGQYWVAESAGTIIGQIMVTYEWSDWRNGVFWWIGSVYIADTHRRQGVFSALYKHVESLAQHDRGVCGIRLYVERGNDRAQQTYRSLSMHDAGYIVMESIFPAGEESTNA
ncbi:MAG: GNAT family N-acetyltransferase [Woeseiaceae bacterium]